jgi:hypothetical protein
MLDKKRPIDVVAWLRSEWHLRDLTSQDFDKAISILLDIQNGTNFTTETPIIETPTETETETA